MLSMLLHSFRHSKSDIANIITTIHSNVNTGMLAITSSTLSFRAHLGPRYISAPLSLLLTTTSSRASIVRRH
ncbi:unnamed protein product [Jaminaea pallidilutea]